MIVSIALLASLGIFAAGMAAAIGGGRAERRAAAVSDVRAADCPHFGDRRRDAAARSDGRSVLLAEGEIATAQVTKRWMARNGPNIRYEFTTPLGEHFTRGAADGSRQLSVGMSVPIFYDPQRPKKQLALCASFYEVVLPGKE